MQRVLKIKIINNYKFLTKKKTESYKNYKKDTIFKTKYLEYFKSTFFTSSKSFLGENYINVKCKLNFQSELLGIIIMYVV